MREQTRDLLKKKKKRWAISWMVQSALITLMQTFMTPLKVWIIRRQGCTQLVPTFGAHIILKPHNFSCLLQMIFIFILFF